MFGHWAQYRCFSSIFWKRLNPGLNERTTTQKTLSLGEGVGGMGKYIPSLV